VQHYGNWHLSDGKLIQTDWSGSGPFVVIWAIVAADSETLTLRIFETGPGHLKHCEARRTYKRMHNFPKDPGPNQAMQPTAGRRTDSLHFMKTLPAIFTRALTSRG